MTEAATRLPAIADFVGRLAWRPLPVLALLAFIVCLPGLLSLPPLDRDESRFAEASRQMVQTGNFVDIRFASGPRYNKPIGIYWLQAASAELLAGARGDIRTYRVPSLLGGLLAAFFTYTCARAFAPPPVSLLAAGLLTLTLLFAIESDIATTDAALLAAIVVAQGVWMRVYLAAREEGRKPPAAAVMLAGWAALGFGVLLKGPVILAVLGATILALSLWDGGLRWLRGTRPLTGFLLAVAIVAPWAIAIGFESHGGFYRQSLGHDFAAKLLGGQESHGAPPGYYLVLASLTFWPATLFLLPALGAAISRRREPAVRYLLAWAGASWLMFELVPTKLPHYILPAYPALAILAALWATARREGEETRRNRILRLLACAQFALGLLLMAAAVLVLPQRLGGATTWQLAMGGGIFLAAGLTAVICLFRKNALGAAMSAGGAALVLYPLVAFAVTPQLRELWIAPRAAALAAKDRRFGDPPVVLAGYVEPSLVFLLGDDARVESGGSAANLLAAKGGLALVDDRQRGPFLTRLSELSASASQVDQLAGLNYSSGRREHIAVFRVTGPRRAPTPPADRQ